MSCRESQGEFDLGREKSVQQGQEPQRRSMGFEFTFQFPGDFPEDAFKKEALVGSDCQELGRLVREEVEAVSVV